MTELPRSDNRVLRLNVGFLLKESAGYTREFTFDQPGRYLVGDIVIEQLHGSLRLTRTRQGIVVQGTLRTYTAAECVRCLKPIMLPCDVELADLFVYPAPPAGDSPFNYYIVQESGHIELEPILREEGILAVPMQALCAPDCKGLCPQCGQNLNEATCDCAQENVDPRFSALRALLSSD